MKHHLPAGTTASGLYTLQVTPQTAGWAWTALRILELGRRESATFRTGGFETLVLPLSGSCTIACDDEIFELEGRRDVFSRVTDFAYIPRDATVTVTGRGRFALPAARCERRLPARYAPAEDVPVELRGAGRASRQVNNFCLPEAFEADRLIACEVLIPEGNRSSYPPHKHDEDRPGECVLEEICYFEVPGGGMGYQRVYGTGRRPIDVLAEVRTGDVVLIPYGWHGPSMAAPGYDLYHLNVMAGPSAERGRLICDDPAHAWVRSGWAGQQVDPRLPVATATEGSRPQASDRSL